MTEPKTDTTKLKVSVDHEEYLIEIRELSDKALEVLVNGQAHLVAIEEVEQFGARAMTGMHIPTPSPMPPPSSAPRSAAVQTGQPGAISAPMPGDIVEIKVKEGEEVKIGQELCVLEAMKMRNMIRAPQAGTVSLIEVSVGDSVKYGAPLMWVE